MPRCGGCGAGWRSLGERVSKLCEYDGEEPGHAKLHRMIEEREREQAAARARAKQMALEEERCALEWQAELKALERQRERMDEETLEQDCLSHFACAEVLLNARAGDASPEADARERALSGGDECGPEGGLPGAEAGPGAEEAGPPPPEGPVERWLAELFGGPCPGSGSACSSPRSLRPFATSFGELPAVSCSARLAESLSEALARGADEAEEAAREAEGAPTTEVVGLSDALDQLLRKYEVEEVDINGGVDAETVNAPSTEAETSVKELRARAAHHRTVGGRLVALLPCLSEDAATTRLASALSALDIGSAGAPYSAAACSACDFRAPLRALSTADACWALCSEKCRLVTESLLPGALAQGHWSWPELRRTGLGWWLCGTGTEEVLDSLATRLAQSAVAQLRQASSASIDPGPGCIKRLADEALFWYVLLGTKLARLRALVKTGILSGEPALAQLLEHPRSGEAQFIRKNAFRLLQLHRFHLAAALFVLSGSHEEAARVVAGHMHDLQLAVVLSRRWPAVAAEMLRDRLAESPLAARDPWLRLLLAWRAGDREAVFQCACGPVEAEPAPEAEDGAVAPLFDGALRLATSREGLEEVAERLLGARAGG